MKIFNTKISEIPLEISYFDNEVEAPTLLFIHGLGCSKNDFSEANNYLSKYRIISLDFPGCGNSNYNRNLNLTTNDLVQIINNFVNYLDLKDFFIIGHSYGGLIALKYAKEYKVKGIINIEGLWEIGTSFSARKTLKIEKDKYIKENFPNTIFWLKKLNNIGSLKYAETLENLTNPIAFYKYSQAFTNTVDENDSIDEFLSLEIPKLFIYGEKTQGLTFIQKLENSSKIAIIKDSYHFPNYDNPKDFYEEINKFIENCSPFLLARERIQDRVI